MAIKTEMGILSYSPKLDFTSYDVPLIGHGEQYDDCGQWTGYKGCLDVDAHNKTLNPLYHNKAVVYHYPKTCHRPDCPICFESWVSRATKRATHRLHQYAKMNNRRPVHVILSPRKEFVLKYRSVQHLRRKAVQIAKKYGLVGGSLIYHPKSRQCLNCGSNMLPRKNRCHKCGLFGWRWVFNPHFHFIGFGWLVPWDNGTDQCGKEFYKKYRWVVRNLKVRKTISGTVWYELSHCGYLGERKRIVQWFGSMNFKEFHCSKPLKDKKYCPVCSKEMKTVVKIAGEPLPHVKGNHFCDPEHFRYKKSRHKPMTNAEIKADNKKLQKIIDRMFPALSHQQLGHFKNKP